MKLKIDTGKPKKDLSDRLFSKTCLCLTKRERERERARGRERDRQRERG